MKKIPTLFLRDPDNPRLVTTELNPECAWVLAGEGRATEKLDGTACMIRSGVLYKRYNWKRGPTPPADYENADPERAGHHGPGWIPVDVSTADQWHRQAIADGLPADGTYELIGPKVSRNPYDAPGHRLVRHGSIFCKLDVPATLLPKGYPDSAEALHTALSVALAVMQVEGFVWHHPDGRMAKTKARDFGIKWPRPGGIEWPRIGER